MFAPTVAINDSEVNRQAVIEEAISNAVTVDDPAHPAALSLSTPAASSEAAPPVPTDFAFRLSVDDHRTPSRSSLCSQPINLRDVIARNKHFYRFACFTGIIKPMAGENRQGCTQWNIRYRLWVNLLHFFFVLEIVVVILYAVVELTVQANSRYTLLVVSEAFGMVAQSVLIIPAVVFLRRELTVTRSVNLQLYAEAFDYALKKGQRLWVYLMLLLLAFVLVISVSVGGGWGAFLFFILLFCFTPSNCFLTGVFTFLVMEQQLSFYAMQEAEEGVKKRTLTREEYLQIRESIDYRDSLNPVNWLVSAAVLSMLFAMIIIPTAHTNDKDAYALAVFGEIVFVLSIFGRQFVVLFNYLYEMSKVNAIADSMLEHLAKDCWESEKMATRFDLYILMKEMPLGSSLFFFRPSKLSLILQVGSTVIGVGFAVFWAFVFA